MAIFNVPMFVGDGEQYAEFLDKLYEKCVAVGLKMDSRYETYKNTQRTGKIIAIGELVTGIAEGRFKISVAK